jgi:hypothetical protein
MGSDESVTRLGVTLPLEGLELHEHRAAIERLSTAGYVDLWSGEVSGIDGLSQLALVRRVERPCWYRVRGG